MFNLSNLSITKPIVETNSKQGSRAVRHEKYKYFKEQSVLKSFNYHVQLKADISKFYDSLYTHSVPWVTFGGKDRYKKNRDLSDKDTNKVKVIYGDEIDRALSNCQNEQTLGIPIGPDTSLIVSEIIACHVDVLLEQRLKRKKIDWVGFRYHDDYLLHFHSELDAQTVLSELRAVLSEFELRINDEKTFIGATSNNLESDWVLSIKTFFFSPSEKEQKEDIWNFFALVFKLSRECPKESVLRFALNKFKFVRINKDSWIVFESLLFRLGLTEPSSLSEIAKILVSYKSLVNKNNLKSFCFEMIKRHAEKGNDYELTWSLWILKEFELQPTKEVFTSIFKSKSVCACLIAFDLLEKKKLIKGIDFSDINSVFTTENLNKEYWLLVYETAYNKWLPSLDSQIVNDHFYFKILKDRKVSFYDATKRLEPITVETSSFSRIENKIIQIENYISKNKIKNEDLKIQIELLSDQFTQKSKDNNGSKQAIQEKLEKTDNLSKFILSQLNSIETKNMEFNEKKLYYVLGKRFLELSELTSKEIEYQNNPENDLLFNPNYE